jgi:hypothetical protein
MGFSADCDQVTLENLGGDSYSFPAAPLCDELEELPRIGTRSTGCLFSVTSGIVSISGPLGWSLALGANLGQPVFAINFIPKERSRSRD